MIFESERKFMIFSS